jgi:hypothetical protein
MNLGFNNSTCLFTALALRQSLQKKFFFLHFAQEDQSEICHVFPFDASKVTSQLFSSRSGLPDFSWHNIPK